MKKRQWLIDLRIKKGIEQQQIAKEAGITVSHMYYIEQGQRNPRIDVAKKIADILNVSWTKFYED